MSQYENIMLISPNTVKAIGGVALNVDDSFIGTAIRTAQNVYLEDVIGKEFLDSLKQKVYDGSINEEANTAYKELLDSYIKFVLSSKVIVELAMGLSFKIRNLGTVRNTDTNANYPSLQDVQYLLDYHRTAYNHYLNRMSDFICDNKAAFVEAEGFGCGGCKTKKRYANTQLYLGN